MRDGATCSPAIFSNHPPLSMLLPPLMPPSPPARTGPPPPPPRVTEQLCRLGAPARQRAAVRVHLRQRLPPAVRRAVDTHRPRLPAHTHRSIKGGGAPAPPQTSVRVGKSQSKNWPRAAAPGEWVAGGQAQLCLCRRSPAGSLAHRVGGGQLQPRLPPRQRHRGCLAGRLRLHGLEPLDAVQDLGAVPQVCHPKVLLHDRVALRLRGRHPHQARAVHSLPRPGVAVPAPRHR
eukprot:COSAG01_NODE_1720_length_9391_cov_27.761085_3_plen_232_part_00